MFDTAGRYIPFYDMCGYCDMDTGGNHRHWCPCYQPINEPTLASEMKVNIHFQQLVEQGIEDIRQEKVVQIPSYSE